ncbi:unnamed protein product [Caenorhabditis sp. 36 PRJEB53466]|nr:unnamed protein product [Caenorhabditis sp. 36 PRJEB53466]
MSQHTSIESTLTNTHNTHHVVSVPLQYEVSGVSPRPEKSRHAVSALPHAISLLQCGLRLVTLNRECKMNSDDDGPHLLKSSDLFGDDDGPTSVFEQALEDMKLYPDNQNFVHVRLFGEPASESNPCRTCHKVQFFLNSKPGDKNSEYFGLKKAQFEALHDTCPTHYRSGLLETKAKREAANAEAERKRNMRKKKKRAKNDAPRASFTTEPIINFGQNSMFSDDTDPVPAKKKKGWPCPKCNKSARYGSVGCHWCGEWFHTHCAGYRSQKMVPKQWLCDTCS